MRLIPFDRHAVIILVVAALLPIIPLIGTAISIQEILSKLAELLA